MGYNIMIGDMQVNIDPMVDTDRRDPLGPKHLHESFNESKNFERLTKKKMSTTQVMTAGGTGGGIRQNAKVIKSKNAVKLGVWSGQSTNSPRRGGPNDGVSDLGNVIS